MGTPALPIADTTDIKSQRIIEPSDNSKPPFCIRNNDVTRIKAAHPFMLIVVHIGKTNRAISGFISKFSSADCMVTGHVPAELLVKRATNNAGNMARKTLIGLSFLAKRNSGSTTNI